MSPSVWAVFASVREPRGRSANTGTLRGEPAAFLSLSLSSLTEAVRLTSRSARGEANDKPPPRAGPPSPGPLRLLRPARPDPPACPGRRARAHPRPPQGPVPAPPPLPGEEHGAASRGVVPEDPQRPQGHGSGRGAVEGRPLPLRAAPGPSPAAAAPAQAHFRRAEAAPRRLLLLLPGRRDTMGGSGEAAAGR